MRRRQFSLLVAASCAVAAGCHGGGDHGSPFQPAAGHFFLVPQLAAPPPPSLPPLPDAARQVTNPLIVPVRDREFFWNQLVDTVDDYFDVQTERRVQLVGDVLTEGRIETESLPGATALEPWLWDSRPGYQRQLATLQSIRRRASVRVVPLANAYEVHVMVSEELEDVGQSVAATPGASIPRFDALLAKLADGPLSPQNTVGWIPLGRDAALEQEILQQLAGRLSDQSPWDEPRPTSPP